MKSVRLSSLIVCDWKSVDTEGWMIEDMGCVLISSRGTHVHHLDNGHSGDV
jgi:hypothetical protein